MRSPAALVLLAAVAVPLPAYADNSPLAPGDPAWAARGQLGYSKTSGNTDNSAGNFLLHVAHVTGRLEGALWRRGPLRVDPR